MYAQVRKDLAGILVGHELWMLESAAITLFDIKPSMRLYECTGERIVRAVYQSAQQRSDEKACGILKPFYDVVCKHYTLENVLDQISAAAQEPSPSAEASPSAARLSAPRDTRQVS